jgi:hypothetical protein
MGIIVAELAVSLEIASILKGFDLIQWDEMNLEVIGRIDFEMSYPLVI